MGQETQYTTTTEKRKMYTDVNIKKKKSFSFFSECLAFKMPTKKYHTLEIKKYIYRERKK